jgi:hypothetical protein
LSEIKFDLGKKSNREGFQDKPFSDFLLHTIPHVDKAEFLVYAERKFSQGKGDDHE